VSDSSVFWKMFTETGEIGHYLLYKYTSEQFVDDNVEQEQLSEVASERG